MIVIKIHVDKSGTNTLNVKINSKSTNISYIKWDHSDLSYPR